MRYWTISLVMMLFGLQMMADDICTFDDAKRYCDTMPLDNIEGIWEYPEDHVCVLIMRNQTYGSGESYPYKLIVVDSYDAMTVPGEEIGTISPTPSPTKYKMVLYTQRKKNKLSTPKSCSAELAHNNYALIVKSDRRWIDINPLAILPKFWRVARLKSDKPTEKLPKGLIKIYPSYDGNGSSYFKPRYL